MSIVKLNPLPIRFHCYKVLPLVYDDALSYYEQLCKVVKTLNDAIKAIDDINAAISDLSNLPAKVAELENNINTFESNVNSLLNQMNDTLEEYDDRFNDYDTRFNELEDKLTREINNNVKALKDYIDEALNNLEAQIASIIEKEIEKIYVDVDKIEKSLIDKFNSEIQKLIESIPDLTNIEVINPVTGRLSKVQIALDDLFMNTRYNALTVDEFNHLHLSVNECNKLMYQSVPTGWSIIVWLSKAKELFDKNLKHRMANAITGAWQDFKKSIEENTDMLRVCGCLTASEFGDLGLTVDAFNEVGATCEELAWSSNRIFA